MVTEAAERGQPYQASTAPWPDHGHQCYHQLNRQTNMGIIRHPRYNQVNTLAMVNQARKTLLESAIEQTPGTRHHCHEGLFLLTRSSQTTESHNMGLEVKG